MFRVFSFFVVTSVLMSSALAETTTGDPIADLIGNEQTLSALAEKPEVHIVYDITRDGRHSSTANTASVYVNGRLARTFTVRGGRNQYEQNKRGEWNCSYTTTGTMRPTSLIRDKRSGEWDNVAMPYYIEFDAGRGLGAHQGDLGSYSGGCVRQSANDSRWLFEQVKAASVMDGNRIVATNATIQVVDNTPGMAEARAACEARKRGGGAAVVTPPIPANPPAGRGTQQVPQKRRTLMDILFPKN